jgi:hypothetical protein
LQLVGQVDIVGNLLADRLFSETLAGTGSYCYRPGDLKESSGEPF